MPFNISEPSFRSLYVEMHVNGIKIGRGTAFVVASPNGANFLVTNRHNVTGRHQDTGAPLCEKTAAIPDSITVWHNLSAELGMFVPVVQPLLLEAVPQWIEHPVLGAAADFVVLPVEVRSDIALYPYTLDHLSHTQIEPGSRVSVVGFPFGERTGASFAVWATGFVASEPEMDHGGRPVFLIDCRSREGQSGSPVVRYWSSGRGSSSGNEAQMFGSVAHLYGIYSGRINKESDIGVVWKSWAIQELVTYASTL